MGGPLKWAVTVVVGSGVAGRGQPGRPKLLKESLKSFSELSRIAEAFQTTFLEISSCKKDAHTYLRYRSGSKKALKFRNFDEIFLFSKNMDQDLSKSGLRMFLRPLVMIL